MAVGVPSIIPRFLTEGSMRLDKADQPLCYMNEEPIGPGFVSEVEAFLSGTGIGHRRFGSNATGAPLFVMKLRTGATPSLSTFGDVQAWVRANRCALEPAPGVQGQDVREPSLLDRSSEPIHREEPAEALPDPVPSNDVHPHGITVYTTDGPR